MRVLANVWGLFFICLLLSGCDQSAETFGASYDECLLKNLGQSDTYHRQKMVEACQRHFERKPSQRVAYLDSWARMTTNADKSRRFEFLITNKTDNAIVTGFTVTVYFYKGRVSHETYLTEFSWPYRKELGPLDRITVYGRLDKEDFVDGVFSSGAKAELVMKVPKGDRLSTVWR